MIGRLLPVALLVALAGLSRAEEAVLAPPVRLDAADGPIDVEGGHAAPLVCDWDGDGRADLLVGQFTFGRLLIFRNEGKAGAPRLAAPTVFLAAGAEGTVPSG
jgi:hypothetical protein